MKPSEEPHDEAEAAATAQAEHSAETPAPTPDSQTAPTADGEPRFGVSDSL